MPTTKSRQLRRSRQIAISSLLLVVTASTAALINAFPTEFSGYKRYLTEQRSAMNFTFNEISEDWSETDLKAHFKDHRFSCYENQEFRRRAVGDRNCFTEINAHNGAPAMTAEFFFTGGRLYQATVLAPSWTHSAMLNSVRHIYGEPVAARRARAADVRLYGWALPNGSAIFCNQNYPLNPLGNNAIFWRSARECQNSGCFLMK